MAYMVAIDRYCQDEHCRKLYTHQVFDRTNSPIGKFCKKHAEAMVDTVNGWED